MFPTDNKLKLVQIYFFVCEQYENNLKYLCERFSNNKEPEFTDQEAMTIYLFSMSVERRFQVKEIYNFAKDYLIDWFPKLPSYATYSDRINRLNEAFKGLAFFLLSFDVPKECSKYIALIDSLPIITCSGKRKAKVALDITDKGYCSTKNMYYYGLKLHALAHYHAGHLPHPDQIILTKASENDLACLKPLALDLHDRLIFGDKIYGFEDFWADRHKQSNVQMLTPIKDIKGQSEKEKQRNKAYNELFSTAVSKIRQPIESLFNWLIEKTKIQTASKVRSTKGLLTFIFGRIASAYINLIF